MDPNKVEKLLNDLNKARANKVNVQEIKNIKSGMYDFDGNFEFEVEDGTLKVKAVDALEIAYTLFDWAGQPYTILDEINERID